jgi:hypothetical protein
MKPAQVKVTIVYPSVNVAIPTLHDKQSLLAEWQKHLSSSKQ